MLPRIIIKEIDMVKSKEDGPETKQENPAEPKTAKFKFSPFRAGIWLFLILALLFVLRNPRIATDVWSKIQNIRFDADPAEDNAVAALNEEVRGLYRQIADLNMRMNEISQTAPVMIDDAELAEFRERFNAIEKQNLNVIDSKADVATVLGLITRLDRAEEKLDALGKVTDDGALILSAAMMVKEAADRSGSFEYEAEVLSQLAQGNAKIKDSVEILTKYSKAGVHTEAYLQDEFQKVYAALLKQQKAEFAKNWKDRLNSKLNEIIKVKRVNKEAPEFQADKALEKARQLVDDGEIFRAAALLESPENADLAADAGLAGWLKNVEAKHEVDSAVSRISTYSLALMKVNHIKKETKND